MSTKLCQPSYVVTTKTHKTPSFNRKSLNEGFTLVLAQIGEGNLQINDEVMVQLARTHWYNANNMWYCLLISCRGSILR